jgi:hypothetical protein
MEKKESRKQYLLANGRGSAGSCWVVSISTLTGSITAQCNSNGTRNSLEKRKERKAISPKT